MSEDEEKVPTSTQCVGLSEEYMWTAMESIFANLRVFAEDYRLETFDEALGKQTKKKSRSGGRLWRDGAPEWFDEDLNVYVKSWLLIPFVAAIDDKERSKMKEIIDNARHLIPELEELFRRRELTARFLFCWGGFCAAMGAVELIALGETSIGHYRSAQAGGEGSKKKNDDYRIWYAKYFIKHYKKRGDYKFVSSRIEKLVNDIVDGKYGNIDGFDVKWFEGFLDFTKENEDGSFQLRELFSQSKNPVDKLRRLAERIGDHLPPLDLDEHPAKPHP